MKTLQKVKIQENNKIANNTYLLSWERNIDFQAGQHIGITLKTEQTPRLYSIASGTSENSIEIIYTINPQGELTPKLSKLMTGDEIFITNPLGNFILKKQKAWLISNSTGIAPFRSFLRSGQLENQTIIHGSRYLDSFYFQEEFLNAKNINYFRCCSGNVQENSIFAGRVSSFLKEKELLPDNTFYYLCGSTEMVIDVREILLQKKVPFQNIISEIYF